MTDWLEVAFVFIALVGLLALVFGGATAIGFGLMVVAGFDIGEGRLVGSALLLIGGAVLLVIGGLGLD